MGTTSNLARRVFALFLRLYPSSFRKMFGGEMSDVFSEISTDAQGRGITALAELVMREIWGLLAGALSEHWQAFSQKEAAVSDTLEIIGGIGTAKMKLPGGSEPGSWKGALLAGLPHLLMGCFFVTLTLIGNEKLLPSGQSLQDMVGIAFAAILAILLGVVLFYACENGVAVLGCQLDTVCRGIGFSSDPGDFANH